MWALCAFFGQFGRPKMTLFLEMRFCLYKGLKSLFVHLFLSETKVSIEEGPMTLVHFIDWVGA